MRIDWKNVMAGQKRSLKRNSVAMIFHPILSKDWLRVLDNTFIRYDIAVYEFGFGNYHSYSCYVYFYSNSNVMYLLHCTFFLQCKWFELLHNQNFIPGWPRSWCTKVPHHRHSPFPTMKRGAEKQLTKDDGDYDDEIEVSCCIFWEKNASGDLLF